MAEPKTKPEDIAPADYIDAEVQSAKQAEARLLLKMFERYTSDRSVIQFSMKL